MIIIDKIIILLALMFTGLVFLTFAAGSTIRYFDKEYNLLARLIWLVTSILSAFITYRIVTFIWQLLFYT